MRSSLKELKKAIQGWVMMTSDIEGMCQSLLENRVPAKWQRVAYPSNKSLAAWMTDYHRRIQFIRSWLEKGPPNSFWLPGFFFPQVGNVVWPSEAWNNCLQGFLTGVLQMHARKHALPIDSLNFVTSVTTQKEASEVSNAPDDGVFVHGLFLEGAQWDIQAGHLIDASHGAMHSEFPIVHFCPTQTTSDINPKGIYQCPLYKTSTRSGTLSTTGQSTNYIVSLKLPIDPNTSPHFWIRRGTALLCMLDD